jgi:acetyl esterase/lipase
MNLLHGCLKNNVKTVKRIVIPVLILVSSSCFGQEYSKSWKDINCAGDEMNYHNLDIFLPAVERPSNPVVVVIYGNAWFSNNLEGSDLKTPGKALPDGGFAIVMPDHCSSADAKFPAQINDIKAVIRFVRVEMDLHY